jgi:hypothetical protein
MPPRYVADMTKSESATKKFKVVIFDASGETKLKTIHFGAYGMSDYTIHKDPARKARYINRHKARENFADIFTAGFWSRWILWNKPTLRQSITDTEKKKHIKIHYV